MIRLFFALFFFLFIVIRAIHHQPERSNSVEVKAKREVFLASQFTIILFLCQFTWLTSDFLLPAQFTLPTTLQFFGGALMASSILLLQMVHQALGKNFSARLEVQDEHVLIQQGPYQYVRHPMYSTGFIYLIGAGLLSSNWIVLVLPTLSFLLLVVLRIQDEERMLEEHFQEEWIYYKNKTGKFFPKLNQPR